MDLAAGIAGLILFVCKVTREAKAFFDGWHDAPVVVGQILRSFHDLTGILEDLKKVLAASRGSSSLLGANEEIKFRPLMNDCKETFKQLQDLMRKYQDIGQSQRTRSKWLAYGQKEYESLGQRVEAHKSTLMLKLLLARWIHEASRNMERGVSIANSEVGQEVVAVLQSTKVLHSDSGIVHEWLQAAATHAESVYAGSTHTLSPSPTVTAQNTRSRLRLSTQIPATAANQAPGLSDSPSTTSSLIGSPGTPRSQDSPQDGLEVVIQSPTSPKIQTPTSPNSPHTESPISKKNTKRAIFPKWKGGKKQLDRLMLALGYEPRSTSAVTQSTVSYRNKETVVEMEDTSVFPWRPEDIGSNLSPVTAELQGSSVRPRPSTPDQPATPVEESYDPQEADTVISGIHSASLVDDLRDTELRMLEDPSVSTLLGNTMFRSMSTLEHANQISNGEIVEIGGCEVFEMDSSESQVASEEPSLDAQEGDMEGVRGCKNEVPETETIFQLDATELRESDVRERLTSVWAYDILLVPKEAHTALSSSEPRWWNVILRPIPFLRQCDVLAAFDDQFKPARTLDVTLQLQTMAHHITTAERKRDASNHMFVWSVHGFTYVYDTSPLHQHSFGWSAILFLKRCPKIRVDCLSILRQSLHHGGLESGCCNRAYKYANRDIQIELPTAAHAADLLGVRAYLASQTVLARELRMSQAIVIGRVMDVCKRNDIEDDLAAWDESLWCDDDTASGDNDTSDDGTEDMSVHTSDDQTEDAVEETADTASEHVAHYANNHDSQESSNVEDTIESESGSDTGKGRQSDTEATSTSGSEQETREQETCLKSYLWSPPGQDLWSPAARDNVKTFGTDHSDDGDAWPRPMGPLKRSVTMPVLPEELDEDENEDNRLRSASSQTLPLFFTDDHEDWLKDLRPLLGPEAAAPTRHKAQSSQASGVVPGPLRRARSMKSVSFEEPPPPRRLQRAETLPILPEEDRIEADQLPKRFNLGENQSPRFAPPKRTFTEPTVSTAEPTTTRFESAYFTNPTNAIATTKHAFASRIRGPSGHNARSSLEQVLTAAAKAKGKAKAKSSSWLTSHSWSRAIAEKDEIEGGSALSEGTRAGLEAK